MSKVAATASAFLSLVGTTVLVGTTACERTESVQSKESAALSGEESAAEKQALSAPVVPTVPAPKTAEPGHAKAAELNSNLAILPTEPMAYVEAVENFEGLDEEKSKVVECKGGEVKVTAIRYTDESRLVKASLEFSAAGHRSWSYKSYYRDKSPVALRHRVTSWSFAGGTADEPATQDSVFERTYLIKDDQVSRCQERRANGPTGEIEELIQQAAEQEKECTQRDESRILRMENVMSSKLNEASLREICEAKDPSSGMKLEQM